MAQCIQKTHIKSQTQPLPFGLKVHFEAAAEGAIKELTWMIEDMGCPVSYHLCSQAASGGHLTLLQCLFDLNCPFIDNEGKSSLAGSAVRAGHLHVLEWLKEKADLLTFR